MSTFTDALNESMPATTAGALPSSRTYAMMDEAIAAAEQGNIAGIQAELVHTRAHYQALEYALNSEEKIVQAMLEAVNSEDSLVRPETIEDALRFAARVYSTSVVEAAYDNAHAMNFFIRLGVPLAEGLKTLYSELDHSDPEREDRMDAELRAFLDDLDDDE